ncbi:MAG: AraC family transcriptional regulator [Alphaproteobacteria bacterium]|nr:AraC family transcriptional regulator [Alphaproteobacteria bacterium]
MGPQLTAEPVALPSALPIRVVRVKRDGLADPPARFAHFHAVAELVIFETVSGAMHTDAARFELGPGCATWCPSMSAHDFALGQEPAAWTLIQYYQDFIEPALSPDSVCVKFGEDARRRVGLLAEWLEEAVQQGDKEAARKNLELILLHVLRAERKDALPMAASHALGRFRPLLECLRAAPAARIPLGQAASMCGLSPSYFSRLFRDVFGRGFTDYVTQMRVERAAIALASSRKPVSTIGYETGFQSHAYFTAQFRARFGVTPSEFRRCSDRPEIVSKDSRTA